MQWLLQSLQNSLLPNEMELDKRRITVAVILLVIASYGCSSNRGIEDISDTAELISSNSVPSSQTLSRTGNHPYTVAGKTYVPAHTAVGFKERGIASWYGPKFHGKRTSSGEVYDMHKMTAAHKTLPLPTYVSVKNLKNKKRIIVRVNDRGPFIGKRIIDLSYKAAKKLDLVEAGTGMVEVTVISPPKGPKIGGNSQKFYLSAGTFSSKNNANKRRRAIRNLGFQNVKLKEKRVSNSILYQVRIGPISTTAEVDAIVNKLARRLPEKPYLVTE